MKTLLLLLFCIPLVVFGQKENDETVASSANQYGYVNGVRLDSIDATYAQVGLTMGAQVVAGNYIKKFAFEYGQKWKNEREVRVMNKDGKTFLFANTAEALNFFEFNGWNFVLVNFQPYQILLRKKGK